MSDIQQKIEAKLKDFLDEIFGNEVNAVIILQTGKAGNRPDKPFIGLRVLSITPYDSEFKFEYQAAQADRLHYQPVTFTVRFEAYGQYAQSNINKIEVMRVQPEGLNSLSDKKISIMGLVSGNTQSNEKIDRSWDERAYCDYQCSMKIETKFDNVDYFDKVIINGKLYYQDKEKDISIGG